MRSSQIKLGRNDICSCGSGNKYKKCCLSTEMQPLSEKVSFTSIDRKKSPERLTKRIKDNISDQFILLAGEHEIKMSEIILHLAEDLLSFARTKSQIRKAVTAKVLPIVQTIFNLK